MQKDLLKLKKFLEYLGVNAIVEASTFEDGLAHSGYLFPQKIIILRKELDLTQKILSLAHEGGHYINRTKHEFWTDISAHAIDLIRESPNTKIICEFEDIGLLLTKRTYIAQELILEEEKIAWTEAELMLKFLGIKKPAGFAREKAKSLKTYEEAVEEARKYKKTMKVKLEAQ